MSTNYPAIWNNLLMQSGTQNVDIIASINEDSLNHYLQEHHKLDNRVYHREIKKKFNTQTDTREFTVKLDITSPIQLQFPPYKDKAIADEFNNQRKWYSLESDHDGPELQALKDDPNKIQVYCGEVNISISWPKLNPDTDNEWKFSLKTLKVFAEAFAILKRDNDGHYISIIPTIIRFDIADPDNLVKLIKQQINLPKEEMKLLDQCQEKFTDLLVIAMNILATEQTPKLVRNIKIPIMVLKDRPVQPSIFNISDNCLTVGGGIDTTMAETNLGLELEKHMTQLKARMDEDIEKNGGLLNMIAKDNSATADIDVFETKSDSEIDTLFEKTNEYIYTLQERLEKFIAEDKIAHPKTAKTISDGYAVAVNEYLFDTIAASVMPKPVHKCTDWLDIAAVRGRACYWIKFTNPDIKIGTPANVTGAVNIDIGGAIEACVRKFWDCSWRWECGKLAIAVKGRPSIKIKLLKSNGVRIAASMDGDLYLDTNLPFPFNKIIKELSKVIGKFVIAVVNIVLGLLSYIVIHPVISFPQQITKIKLREFNPFNYSRPPIEGNGDTKNNFIGFSGGVLAER